MYKTARKSVVIRRAILDFLEQSQMVISPVSIREIGEGIGGASTQTIQYHVNILEGEGHIRRLGKHRQYLQVLDAQTEPTQAPGTAAPGD